MSQYYQRELDFAISLLKKYRLSVRFLPPEEPFVVLDEELRQILGAEIIQENICGETGQRLVPCTVYKIADPFFCHYVSFCLPGESGETKVVIGPYLTDHMAQETIRKLAEGMKLPMHILPHLVSYYMFLPVYRDASVLMAVITTLGEVLWGDGKFEITEAEYEQHLQLPDVLPDPALIEQETILRQMEQMEMRYAFENELMEIVSKGQISRVNNIMDHLHSLEFERRHTDWLRNLKNYCIVCNTLLRKAAQQGGVHPIYLDKMSGEFARIIENTSSQKKCIDLIGEMIREYCHLVRNSSGAQYSSLIQKTLLYMEANISGDLSLTTLAQQMQVTPSYLSSRFHRETGHTLAEHITELRMKTAWQLLKHSQMQVQSVAQLCGFTDPNYFGKQFKRFYGVTPQQCRKG